MPYYFTMSAEDVAGPADATLSRRAVEAVPGFTLKWARGSNTLDLIKLGIMTYKLNKKVKTEARDCIQKTSYSS
jgi:hypothetical protein